MGRAASDYAPPVADSPGGATEISEPGEQMRGASEVGPEELREARDTADTLWGAVDAR
jgi:hypothetical protein